MEIKIYQNKNEVANAFSVYFRNLVKDKEVFHVALSGGSTPKVIFDILAEEYGCEIDWSKIHFYWGDERCVSPTDEQSNYKMTVTHLFDKVDVPKENIHRIMGESIPEDEAKRYGDLIGDNLSTCGETPEFDLVLLGMGDDGHTASIFPHEIRLWDSKYHCVVAEHPSSGQKRISISGEIINAAKEVIFLVTGANKSEKIEEIHNQRDGYKKYPAALVAPKSNNLTWFIDEAAYSKLRNNTDIKS